MEQQRKTTEIETKITSDLIPYELNPRKHDKNVDVLVELIKKHGFTTAIEVDQHDRIIAGHGRRLAALKLKMIKVPCIVTEVVDDKDYINRVLADNKVAELSKWDNKQLKECMELLGDLQDIDIPGWDDGEIDKLFGLKSESVSESKEAADFGDGNVVDSDDDVDDQALRHTKNFIFTKKEMKFVSSKLKAIKKENKLDTEAEALIFALKPYKGLPVVTRNASPVTEITE